MYIQTGLELLEFRQQKLMLDEDFYKNLKSFDHGLLLIINVLKQKIDLSILKISIINIL